MFNQGFYYVYGGRKGFWFSMDRFDTEEDAEKACINSMKEHVMNLNGTEDHAIFRKGWTFEWNDAGIIKQTTSTELVSVVTADYIKGTNWETEIYQRIKKLKDPTAKEIRQIMTWISNLILDNKLSPDESNWLIELLKDRSQIRKIVDGDFTEGSVVVVNIDGEVISRKVYWSGSAKDLYVVKDNKKYFLCEFYEYERTV